MDTIFALAIDPYGFTYYGVRLTEVTSEYKEKGCLKLPDLEFHAYAYMLPCPLNPPGVTGIKFTIVTEDWDQYHLGSMCMMK